MKRATCTLDPSLENLMSLTLGSAVRALTVFEEIGQKFKVNLGSLRLCLKKVTNKKIK